MKEEVDKLLEAFEEMLTKWENGRHVVKLCYSLNNNHLEKLQKLKQARSVLDD